jgi:hypothetical protein
MPTFFYGKLIFSSEESGDASIEEKRTDSNLTGIQLFRNI